MLQIRETDADRAVVRPAAASAAPLNRFWAGSTISMLGSSLTTLALPLIAARSLNAGPAQMGMLAAAPTAASMLTRVPAGAWADATSRRLSRITAGGELASAVIVAVVPVLWLLHALNFVLLIVVAALAAALAALVEGFAGPLLPLIVAPGRLPSANGRIMVSRSAAHVCGPGLGGLLLNLMAAPVLLVVDAVTFAGSALLTLSISEPPHDPEPAASEPDGKPGRPWRQGFTAVFEDPFLRPCLIFIAGISLANGAAIALLVLLMLGPVGVGASAVGPIVAAGAVGGVVGGAALGRIRARLTPGRTVGLASALLVLSLAPLPVASAGWPGIAACVCYGLLGSFGAVVLLSSVFSEIPARVSPDRIARSFAMANLVPEIFAVAGSLAGGFLATQIGIRATLGIGLAIAVVTACFTLAHGLSSEPRQARP